MCMAAALDGTLISSTRLPISMNMKQSRQLQC
jgi:hypothetical protein